jgi:hypothetical protein
MDDFLFSSPNNIHHLRLLYKSEIRFGPSCYSAHVDGKLIKDKLFGYDHLWTADSRYLIMQEWRSVHINGADTYLFVYDLESGLFNSNKYDCAGWIRPKEVNNTEISFECARFNRLFKLYKDYSVGIDEIENWEKLVFE